MNHRRPKAWSDRYFWMLWAVAVGLYMVTSGHYPVGFFGDDAQAILAARSLGHFHYLDAQSPQALPLYFPLPGFPFVLAPFVAALFSSIELLKLVSVASVGMAILLLAELVRPWMSRFRGLVVIGLFAFNPLTVAAAGRVTAAGFYEMLFLAILLLLRREMRSPSLAFRWVLALLCAWESLVCPEGILLVLAVVIAALVARRDAFAFFIGLASWGVDGLWLARHFFLSAHGPMSSWWGAHWTPTSDWTLAVSQQVRATVWDLGLGAPVTASWAAPVALLAMAFIGLLIMGRGELRFPSGRGSKACLLAGVLYAIFHWTTHVLWQTHDALGLWTVFAILILLIGFAWPSEPPAFRRLGKIGLVIVGGLYTFENGWAIHQTWKHDASLFRSRTDFQVLAQQLPAHSFVFSAHAPAFTLYTGVPATSTVDASDPDALRYTLAKLGVTHVLLEPEDSLSRYAGLFFASAGYKKIIDSPKDTLYQVIVDAQFQNAYRDYLAASDELHLGNWDHGFLLLDQSLSAWSLPEAMNAYAASALLSGTRLDPARRMLEHALETRADYVIAMVNLARVCQREGRTTEAHDVYCRARLIVEKTGQSAYLLTAILTGEKDTDLSQRRAL